MQWLHQEAVEQVPTVIVLYVCFFLVYKAFRSKNPHQSEINDKEIVVAVFHDSDDLTKGSHERGEEQDESSWRE